MKLTLTTPAQWAAYKALPRRPSLLRYLRTPTQTRPDPPASILSRLLDPLYQLAVRAALGPAADASMVLHSDHLIHDVRSHGAKADGVTDDSPAIQSALDAANAAGGGVVLLPSGTYFCDAQLTVGSYTRLIGHATWGNAVGAGVGGTTTLKKGDSVTGALITNKPAAIAPTVEDVALDGNRAGANIHGLHWTGTQNAKTIRTRITGFLGNGLHLTSAKGTRIFDVVAHLNEGHGCYASASNDVEALRLDVINNRIGTDNTVNNPIRSHGLYLDNCNVWHVTQSRFEWSNGYNTYILGAGKITFANCFWDRSTDANIYADGVTYLSIHGGEIARGAASADTSADYRLSAGVYFLNCTAVEVHGPILRTGAQFDDGSGTVVPYNGIAFENADQLTFVARARGIANGGTSVIWAGTNKHVRYLAQGAGNGAHHLRMTDGDGGDLAEWKSPSGAEGIEFHHHATQFLKRTGAGVLSFLRLFRDGNETMRVGLDASDRLAFLNPSGTVVCSVSSAGNLALSGGLELATTTKTTAYTATDADYLILADATAAAWTLTLPTAVGRAGKIFVVKKIDASANAVTIDPNGAQTLDATTTYALTTRHAAVLIISDGTNWHIGASLELSGLTAGSIPYIDANGRIAQANANLFWDAQNARLGLGVATPARRLHAKDANASPMRTERTHTGVPHVLELYNPDPTDGNGTSIALLADTTGAGATPASSLARLHAEAVVHDHATRRARWKVTTSDAGDPVDRVVIDSNGLGVESGGLRVAAVATKTTTYTATDKDHLLLLDATAGAFTVNLPTAAGRAGRILHLKKIDSSVNAITIDPTGSETIDGATTRTLTAQHESVTVISDGTNWMIV